MTQSQWIAIAVAIACVLLASLMVAAEAAFASVSKARAESLAADGSRSG